MGSRLNGLVNIGAAVINFYDKASAVVEWFIRKTTGGLWKKTSRHQR